MIRATLTALSATVLLQGCFLEPKGKGIGGKDYRGFYSIDLPDAYDPLLLENTYRLTWFPTKGPGTGKVEITLMTPSSTRSIPIDTVDAADREYPWSLPATVAKSGYTLTATGEWRIRIRSLVDTSMWDWSRNIHFGSNKLGALRFTSPLDTAWILAGDSMTLRWSATGAIGDSVGLRRKRKGRDPDPVIPAALLDAEHVWRTDTGLADTGYHAWDLLSLVNPSIRASSPFIRVLPRYAGAFSFLYPKPGASYPESYIGVEFSWKALGLPGRTASLTLTCGEFPPFRLGDSLPLSGTLRWVAPDGFPSSADCGVVVASEQDTSLKAAVRPFHISGLIPDPFEDDDTPATGKNLLPFPLFQIRNLTLGDEDWIRFTPRAGKAYVLAGGSRDTVAIDLVGQGGDTAARRLDTAWRIRIPAAMDGEYKVRAAAYRKHAPYSTFLVEYDTAGGFPVKFTEPKGGTTWPTQNATAAWNADTALLSNRIQLHLYEGNRMLWRMHTATALANDGNERLTAPEGLHTSYYRLRLSSALDTTLQAFSPSFLIRGVTPDFYEPDNGPGQAKALIAGAAAQKHTLARNDTDWVQFTADSGKVHTVTLSLATQSKMEAFDSTGASLKSFQGYSGTLEFGAGEAGLKRIRITPVATWGEYSIALTLRDP